MTDHQRHYRRLLRLYPADFRDHYGAEMHRLFAEQLWDARSAGGRRAIAALWARTILDVAVTAPREHLARPSRVRQPVDGSPETVVERRTPRGLRPFIVGLAPWWVFAAATLTVSNEALFMKPPEMIGLPLGVVAVGLAFTLMTFGLVALWLTSSTRAAALAIVTFTFPATALIAVAPTIIEAIADLRA